MVPVDGAGTGLHLDGRRVIDSGAWGDFTGDLPSLCQFRATSCRLHPSEARMSRPHSPQTHILVLPSSTPERELLGKFRCSSGGFQAPRGSTYRQHERWRNNVFRGLKLLEGAGLLVIQQLVPCRRHAKCAGRPVAAGCELTPEGQRVRGFRFSRGLPF
jgi:hypothetical protein